MDRLTPSSAYSSSTRLCPGAPDGRTGAQLSAGDHSGGQVAQALEDPAAGGA